MNDSSVLHSIERVSAVMASGRATEREVRAAARSDGIEVILAPNGKAAWSAVIFPARDQDLRTLVRSYGPWTIVPLARPGSPVRLRASHRNLPITLLAEIDGEKVVSVTVQADNVAPSS